MIITSGKKYMLTKITLVRLKNISIIWDDHVQNASNRPLFHVRIGGRFGSLNFEL